MRVADEREHGRRAGGQGRIWGREGRDGRHRWRGSGLSPERCDRNGKLLNAVDADKPRDIGIDEREPDARGDAVGSRDGEDVREETAGVPVHVAQGALAVVPRRAPRHADDYEARRSSRDRWIGGRSGERRAVVTFAKAG